MLTLPEVRTLVRQNRPLRNCDGYPAEVRSATTALARAMVADGRSCTGIARQLGLAATTLSRWLDEEPAPERTPPAGFTPVLLAQPAAPTSWRRDAEFTVVSPGGYRVEGLDLQGVITLLSQLA